jgi:hypothetical protein
MMGFFYADTSSLMDSGHGGFTSEASIRGRTEQNSGNQAYARGTGMSMAQMTNRQG